MKRSKSLKNDAEMFKNMVRDLLSKIAKSDLLIKYEFTLGRESKINGSNICECKYHRRKYGSCRNGKECLFLHRRKENL